MSSTYLPILPLQAVVVLIPSIVMDEAKMSQWFTQKHKQQKSIFLSLLCIVSLLASASCVLAASQDAIEQDRWHPVIAIGAGALTIPNLGASNYFPIQNTETDEFYQHTADSQFQVAPLVDGFLGVEWRSDSHGWWQAGLDYTQGFSLSTTGTGVILTQGADTPPDTTTYHYNVITRQLLLEGKWLTTVHERYHPYALLGMGASFNKAYDYETDLPPSITFTRMYQDNDTASFSYALGVGVDMDITNHVRLGVGYRFADLGKVSLGSASIDSTPVSGTLSQSHVYSHQALVQLSCVM
jgi:opacity protein-like surface antigen